MTTFKKTQSKVALSNLRDAEMAGRVNQSTDPKLVQSYLELKRAGNEFPPLLVTRDYAVIGGNHRCEMYKLFFKNEDPLIDVVVVDVDWDDANVETQQAIRDLAFRDNWNPNAGLPLDFNGVKRNVRQHTLLERTDAQIMSALGPVYGARTVRRALTFVRQAVASESLNFARRLVGEGLSPVQAARKAGLPKGTDLKSLDKGESKGKARPQQVLKGATACGNKWKYNYDMAHDLFLAKTISQQTFLGVVDAMDRGAETLRRAAVRYRRMALESITENAERLRT